MKIIFAGSGEFGAPTLKALLSAGHEVIQVISQPDRPAGRGKNLTPTPISQFAIANNLHLVRTDNINALSLPPADVMVVIAFGQKISEVVTHHARLGSVNLHASRLPRHRGAAPINWAIIEGDTIAGNSIIRLAARMDAGAVLGMSSLGIGELETAGELHDRLAADGAPLMLDVLSQLENGTVIESVQDESLATHAKRLSRELAAVDFTRNAADLCNQIRGMYPWPGCRVNLLDSTGAVAQQLTFVRGRAVTGDASVEPGMIDGDGHIATVDGAMEIIELQPQGKKPMTLRAFQNGHAWGKGMRITSA